MQLECLLSKIATDRFGSRVADRKWQLAASSGSSISGTARSCEVFPHEWCAFMVASLVVQCVLTVLTGAVGSASGARHEAYAGAHLHDGSWNCDSGV